MLIYALIATIVFFSAVFLVINLLRLLSWVLAPTVTAKVIDIEEHDQKIQYLYEYVINYKSYQCWGRQFKNSGLSKLAYPEMQHGETRRMKANSKGVVQNPIFSICYAAVSIIGLLIALLIYIYTR